MRTTIRIEDDLLAELREEARGEGTSLTRFVNRVLRAGIRAVRQGGRRRRRHREKTHSMGEPRVNLDKALALAALLEDEETLRKMGLRK